MQNRTFFRTMLDILFNNTIVKTIVSIVNFCYEQQHFYVKKLKFYKNMPINNIKVEKYDSRFLFNGKIKIENGK